MLEACPSGALLCRVPGAAFCVTHEFDHPAVRRMLELGVPVHKLPPHRNDAEVDG